MIQTTYFISLLYIINCLHIINIYIANGNVYESHVEHIWRTAWVLRGRGTVGEGGGDQLPFCKISIIYGWFTKPLI